MRLPTGTFVCALAACLLLGAVPAAGQEKALPAARQVTEEERRQVTDIVNVQSATQKVQLLTAFFTAHPTTVMRARLLTHVGVAISREPDAAVRVALAEKFLGLMSSDEERNLGSSVLAEAYLRVGRVDDAFRTVAAIQDLQTLDVRLLVRLFSAGAEEAKQRNLQHLDLSRKYGALAIQSIEANRMPASMNAAGWSDYKAKTLPSLCQTMGIVSLQRGASSDARTYLHKAVELAPTDPLNFVFLGAALHEEYAALAQQMKQLQPGPARDDLWIKASALLDQVIDSYAHALALAAGTPQEEPIRAQLLPDLQGFYKFRHNGSLEGLQALIDKYKKQ